MCKQEKKAGAGFEELAGVLEEYAKVPGSLIPILTVAAMMLLWYEGILLSQEAASF